MIKIISILFFSSFIFIHCWSQSVVKESKSEKTGIPKSQGSKNSTLNVSDGNNVNSTLKDSATKAILLDVLFATNEDCDLYISEEFKGTVNRSKHKYIKLAPGSYVYKAKSKSTFDELAEPFVVKDGDSNEIFIDLLYFVDERNLQRESLKNKRNADSQILALNEKKIVAFEPEERKIEPNKEAEKKIVVTKPEEKKIEINEGKKIEPTKEAEKKIVVTKPAEKKIETNQEKKIVAIKPEEKKIEPDTEVEKKAVVSKPQEKKIETNEEKKIEPTKEAEKIFISTLLSNMISINEGRFIMGNNRAPSDDEAEHPVTITPILFSKYEVTQQQWENVMGYNPSNNKDCNTCPVENVSWEDAIKFIRKINEISDKKFRLPTEAEWEYVARIGGKSEIDMAGGPEEYIKKTAWYYANSNRKTHTVGQKQPNVSGIYDLFGNVSEWCSDWYDADYYKKESNQNNPEGPVLGKEKVFRGGSYNDYSGDRFRPSLRNKLRPVNKSEDIGFRLVMDVN